MINGEQAAGLIEFSVDNNTFYSADTFSAEFSLSETPELAGLNATYWATLIAPTIEILIGFPASPDSPLREELTSIFTGVIDEIEISPLTNKVSLTGRDQTALFIDTKTYEKFTNMTASEIAEKLASSHGLKSSVTPTTTKAGAYYQIDQVNSQDDRPEWDLLTYLAEKESFQVYVSNGTLFFNPESEPLEYPVRIELPNSTNASPVSDATSIEFTRNLTVAKDIRVIVRSFGHKTQKPVTVMAERKRVKSRSAGAATPTPTQIYTYVLRNKTTTEAQEYANSKLRELSQHEIVVSVDMPGDPKIDRTMALRIYGTSTPFDQIYFIDSILRSFSFNSGFTMNIRAKNHSVESSVIV